MAKASYHSGKLNSGSAKHNDKNREWKKDTVAPHIDDERIKHNVNLVATDIGFIRTEQNLEVIAERKYEQIYGKALEVQNNKYMAQRHADKCRTIKQWMTDDKHALREGILQIGSDENKATKDGKELSHKELKMELEICLKELDRNLRDKLGENYVPVYAAIHCDELTPHVHFNYSIGMKKDGVLTPALDKGLEQAGVPLPDPNKKPSKYNNRLVSLTSYIRTTWEDIVLSRGIEIERSEHCDRIHEDQNEHRRKELAKAVRIGEEVLQEQQEIIEEASQTLKSAHKELLNIKANKDKLEKDIEPLKVEYEELQAERKNLHANIKELQPILASLEQKIESAKAESQELNDEIGYLKAEHQNTVLALKSAQGELKEVKAESELYVQGNMGLLRKKKELQEEVNELTEERKSLKQLVAELKQELEDIIPRLVKLVWGKKKEERDRTIDAAIEPPSNDILKKALDEVADTPEWTYRPHHR